MQCIYCGSYFKPNRFIVQTNICTDCDSTVVEQEDSEIALEIELLVNKSGRTQSRVQDSYDESEVYGI